MPSFLRSVVLCLGLSLAACGGGLTPVRPTETVRVQGASADSIGRTIEADERGFVRVELHDGASVWVERSHLAPVALIPGVAVVFRDASGGLHPGVVAEALDRVVTITSEGGARQMVPIEQVLSILHTPLAPPAPDTVVAPEVPATPDPRHFAVRATSTVLYERVSVASCNGAVARILAPDGTALDVSSRDFVTVRAEPGDRVYALWQNETTAYAAIVTALEGRLTHVRYDDGSEEWVRASQIVGVVGAAVAGAGGCPRAGEDTAFLRRGPLSRVVEVGSCEGGRASVHLPGHPETESVALLELHALAVPAGARIEVFWHDSAPYLGWAGASHDALIDVRYDDGTNEATALGLVRWIVGAPVGEAYACPAG